MAQLTSRRSARDLLHRRLIAVQSRVVRRAPPQPGVFFQYPPFQSQAEERVNGLIHGTAALASLAGAIWLVAAAARLADPLMTIGCIAYAASLMAVFTMSTLSHVVEPPRLRQLFRTLDQACIYLLTAGSCTPFFIRYLLPHGWGWMLFVVWGMALVGVWNKLRGHRVNSVSVAFSVALGWLPIIAACAASIAVAILVTEGSWIEASPVPVEYWFAGVGFGAAVFVAGEFRFVPGAVPQPYRMLTAEYGHRSLCAG